MRAKERGPARVLDTAPPTETSSATAAMIDVNTLVGSHDFLFLTLDTLRYDVARDRLAAGRTPNLARLVGTWEERHSPASFTYAAHHAFFAGFTPTPVDASAARDRVRPFAVAFPGSETTGPRTLVLDAPDLVTGLAARGYHTLCIGGVGFFNLRSPLGRVLPGLFSEAHWSDALGVTEPRSTEHQVALAVERIRALDPTRRLFLFLNVSAIHQPNAHYLPGATTDSVESHGAALEYVDRALAPLFDALTARAPLFAILCSDHGTAYGEGGYRGHRVAHPVVWTVPYAEVLLPMRAGLGSDEQLTSPELG
jgi:hypothetical protein